ncbi:hypothetical protein VTK73DRAFT_8990 [Phialemonium thermophilum]|uniref:RING-type domain-containing protein n=1 Tax=Phialemonium thermophilum TaxID=223376 RepID=A0ABR3XMQ0_9PEZI
MASLLVLALIGAQSTLAASVSIFPMDHLTDWMQASAMSLEISSTDGAVPPLKYTVVPLTAKVGLNQTDKAREAISIRGDIVSVTPANFNNVTSDNLVAYLGCDDLDTGFLSQEYILDHLMQDHLKAILLYTTKGTCCNLGGTTDIPFQSVFTMTDASEAAEALNITDTADGVLQASITGNVTENKQGPQSQPSGSNSAVAMSILYSITGLITLLFLIIIATGAIRAHRYPERYGPRSGYGGRPRQSRAKGIARAVLETLPIVKFGDPTPAKPDPARELEDQPARPSHDPNSGTRLSAIPEEPQASPRRMPSDSTSSSPPSESRETATAPEQTPSAPVGTVGSDDSKDKIGEEENLGCSICTEDFTVGEDVRVLPCNHKFHPPCIDPWLINVSGTCPLCRLDLRPRDGDPESATNVDELTQLPPPLEVDGGDAASNNHSQRRRSSRLLDLHRLRHASVEERIEILRRHRSQQQQSAVTAATGVSDRESSSADLSDRHGRARLADRLRERFRIRTRAQSPPRGQQNEEGLSSSA